ncbi:M67 family metallopeptidase [Caldilinea sp.]|uniref:M67 family metallopeptidase n=1 Tax=Caldilinea sp. TaxID=2293560 RepID=UPI002BF987EA|nr:M67 family metallopeptidase [Anaerolineales bacterium]HQY95247.1 M67 family metallopeptidase [Caldilinea sp.]HRA66244.1 M67 family metallopeptidase [Caldilinea sp.]
MRASEAVKIPVAVAEAIIAHAREGKPEEVCGIVRGRGLVACEAVRGRNIAAERIENYDVDPQTLLLQFTFEDQGDEMMAIYHSHPASVAYPSATDAWNAHYPDSIYLICSLEVDDAPVLRAFRMTPHWIELELARLRRDLPFQAVRSGLFGYFQPADAPAPPLLAPIAALAPAPFYVDFYTDDRDRIVDSRIVSIVEHPIDLVTS